MASGALFGNTIAVPGSTGGSKHLVEVKAGRMNLKGKMCVPDKRKGLLYIYQSDDSLMHVCWKDRSTGVVEDDLIIFPDDCEYARVPQCTTGRVYVLKFKSSSRKLIFWLQEPKTDKDDENCKKINDILNNPPGPNSSSGGLTSSGNGGTTSGSGSSGGISNVDQDLQCLLNNMSQSQLIQLFGGVGQIGNLSNLLSPINRTSSSDSSARVSGTPSRYQINNSSGNNVSKNQNTPTTTASSATSEGTNQAENWLSEAASPPVDLAPVLTAEVTSSVINDDEAVDKLSSLLPSTKLEDDDSKDGTPNPREEVKSTLQSPQFNQAVSMFSNAFQYGQLGPVVQQLAVNEEAVKAADKGDMKGFLQALEKSDEASTSDEKPPSTNPESKNKENDDEEIQVD